MFDSSDWEGLSGAFDGHASEAGSDDVCLDWGRTMLKTSDRQVK